MRLSLVELTDELTATMVPVPADCLTTSAPFVGAGAPRGSTSAITANRPPKSSPHHADE